MATSLWWLLSMIQAPISSEHLDTIIKKILVTIVTPKIATLGGKAGTSGRQFQDITVIAVFQRTGTVLYH
jgi:hypothetical protein